MDDTAKMPQLWYHAFILSMIYPSRDSGYAVESNIEAGYGRADIILFHKSEKQKHGIVLEFKTITASNSIADDDDLIELASKAVRQIEGKDSFARLKDKSQRAYLFGVAVVKKFVAVECKEVSLSSST